MKYVIYAPSFHEGAGGAIVLHELCHLLNCLGREAFVWPFGCTPAELERYAHHKTPLADVSLLDDAVVVYPEIVRGNPLKSRRVVRWFLNKPSRLTGKVDYGDNELYFFYAQAFDDPEINNDPTNELRVQKIFGEIFHDQGNPARRGSCYLLRKGKGRKIVHDLTDSIEIKRKTSLRRIADVFNRTKYCLSYDVHTMLSLYAVLCGCTSVVVPLAGLSRERWRLEHDALALGVAYGFGDIGHALETAPLVREKLLAGERASIRSVERFAARVETFFGD